MTRVGLPESLILAVIIVATLWFVQPPTALDDNSDMIVTAPDAPKDAAWEVEDDGYRFPEGIHINRLEPADDRIPVNGTVSLEVNVTNERNETVRLSPPVYIYNRDLELVVSLRPLNLTLEPGETVHREVDFFSPSREGDLQIGIDWYHRTGIIGHVEVYNASG